MSWVGYAIISSSRGNHDDGIDAGCVTENQQTKNSIFGICFAKKNS